MRLSPVFSAAVLLALIPLAAAQSQLWGQCGGEGWTGPTTCVVGSVCTYSNPYYSQCLPGTTTSSSSKSATTTTTSSSTGPTGSSSGLNDAAKADGKLYFGTATDSNEFDADATYLSIVTNIHNFGQYTPGNSMKWDATEPEEGTFSFTESDQLVALAKEYGQLVRGHNCVWYNQLPSWVTSGDFSSSQLTTIVQNHCSTIVGHYKGEIYAWDVINEPFNDDGTWRSDVFYNTLGTSYVPIALDAASTADSNAKLYINEYNIEYTGAKATAIVNLVSSLKSAGTPVNGVGFQCHFIVGEVPTSTVQVMNQVTALGLEVAVTELDIRMTVPATTASQNQQVIDYGTAIKNCASVTKCVGVTVWDFTDKYSWIPSTFSGQGDACIWDSNLQVKQALYNAVIAAF